MAGRDWQTEADRLAAASLAAGSPTAWFDRLWASGRDGEVTMPWDSREPHPLLAQWGADQAAPEGRAVVVGCGLGADAEFVAGLGYRTTAFDISPTAVDLARRRYPGSPVEYRSADLLQLPAEWSGHFDLVVDVYTVQALPLGIRAAATAALAQLVAPGGTLVAVMAGRDSDSPPEDGPPWPLSEAEINAFANHGLSTVLVERLELGSRPGAFFWRGEFSRPAAA